jgi:hypothetical protein
MTRFAADETGQRRIDKVPMALEDICNRLATSPHRAVHH